jgi:hypothetical protein
MINVDLYAALFSWAVSLSGYSSDGTVPTVAVRPHEFFVQQACGGSPCKVLGWYPSTKGDTVYVDESMHPDTSVFDSSIVVHEFVHYLQGTRIHDRPLQCVDYIEEEREAYNVQRKFIEAYGDYIPIGFSLMDIQCK